MNDEANDPVEREATETPESISDFMEKRIGELRSEEGIDETEQETNQEDSEADSEGTSQAEPDAEVSADGTGADTDGERKARSGTDQGNDGKDTEDDPKPVDKQEPETSEDDLDPEAADDALAEKMNERTRERFDHFRTEAKDLGEQLETARNTNDQFYRILEDSGTNADQMNVLLSFAKAVNTGNFTAMDPQIWQQMQGMVQRVAIGVGDQSAQVKLPEDLQAAVDNMDITDQYARELATNRARQAMGQQYAQQQYQRSQATQQQTTAHQAALQQVEQWEMQMTKNDPDFASKQKIMEDGAEQLFKSVPPDRWLTLLQREYNQLTNTMQSIEAQRQKENARKQPMRPGPGGGSREPANDPKTIGDYITSALPEIRERERAQGG